MTGLCVTHTFSRAFPRSVSLHMSCMSCVSRHCVIRLTMTGLFVTYNQSLEDAPGSLSLRAQQVRVEIPKRQLATEMTGCCYCS